MARHSSDIKYNFKHSYAESVILKHWFDYSSLPILFEHVAVNELIVDDLLREFTSRR